MVGAEATWPFTTTATGALRVLALRLDEYPEIRTTTQK
jgi:hypothetical protein